MIYFNSYLIFKLFYINIILKSILVIFFLWLVYLRFLIVFWNFWKLTWFIVYGQFFRYISSVLGKRMNFYVNLKFLSIYWPYESNKAKIFKSKKFLNYMEFFIYKLTSIEPFTRSLMKITIKTIFDVFLWIKNWL